MSYRCVIVDDEKPARDRVRRLLDGERDFEVVGEAGDADSAAKTIAATEPDLVFLDVQMPEGDGFDVLRRLAAASGLPRVIFTTAYDQYAVRAFEVGSLDYLLKPFTRARFAEALGRAREALGRGEDASERLLRVLERLDAGVTADAGRITARKGARIVVLDAAEVLWFEAEETLVFARTAEARFLVERTLSDLETAMGAGYFRAHRRYLVNLGRVREILPGDAGTYRIVVDGAGDDEVPLSRRQARRLREILPW